MNNEKKYISVIVTLPIKSQKDLVSCSAIGDFNADGVEEYSLIEKNVDEILGERAYSGADVPDSVIEEVNNESINYDDKIKVFFYKEDYEKKAEIFINYLITENIQYMKNIENWEDWNTKWREHYKKISISDTFHVVPSWEKVDNNLEDIYIYPGQGFGTGGHETTFLCLKAYEEFSKGFLPKDKCLDLGCGSGILGIAAIKRSNMLVDFCDVDKASLDNCLQNLELNFEDQNLEGNLLVLRDRLQVNNKYKLVFANILKNVLIEEKTLILNSLEENSILIMSGLLKEQKEDLVLEYNELNFVKDYVKGDWCCLVFKKG